MLLYGAGALHVAKAQSPPNAPVITEPATNGQIVSPFDVHMETQPMSSPDTGVTHECSDWEIAVEATSEVIWGATCATGIHKVHIHLGDGLFQGSYSGFMQLLHNTNYALSVRHRDDRGLCSAWASRSFKTGSSVQNYPMVIADVSDNPIPVWVDASSNNIILPPGATPPSLRVENSSGGLLLRFAGLDGVTNAITNPPALTVHLPVRVVIEGGSSGVTLPVSGVVFTDDGGISRMVYLPPLNLPAGQAAYFWISENGSSYTGNAGQTTPDFSILAQGSPVPWSVKQPGFKVEVFATGFQLPVSIAFVPSPGAQPDDPYFYVTELYGTIKVVRRNGTVSAYASNLLNFNPTGEFPGSGEQGISGIVVEPVSGDVIVTMLYDGQPPNGPHYPKIVRFHSADGGRTAATQTTVLDMVGEEQGESHFISNITIGPDGKLYVHLGDGFATSMALDSNSFRGKIIRLNFVGSAPPDNPFYDASRWYFCQGLCVCTRIPQSIWWSMEGGRRLSL